MLDLAIIGAGPAALSAAIYTTRAGLKVKVFEQKNYGGILAEIPLIENYPGFVGSGEELARNMRTQAEQSGAKFSYGECTKIEKKTDIFVLTIDGEEVSTRTALIATGSKPKELSFKLDIPVSYCALCDGAFTKDKNVVVVGGANSAVQESIYLANIAKKITIITHSQLKADVALLNQLKGHQNITIREQIEPTPEILNQFDYCFVYIGKTPATNFLEDCGILDQNKYIICEGDSHQTKLNGLFAAGDVRVNSIKQVVAAAADGAAAAIEIIQELI